MKFVTWNCDMALDKKFEKLLTLGADIMVIQECSKSHTEQVERGEGWSSWWVGENKNKGLGVLVKPPWIIREAQTLKPKWAGKVVVDGPVSIDLFPVWAHMSKSPGTEYIEQVHHLLDIIEDIPISPCTIVAGDFNSNKKWDDDYRINKNHSAAVERFRILGLESAYHVSFGHSHGAERQHPTHWNRKEKDPGYHVDYVFLSRRLLSTLMNVVVGRFDDWISVSAHAPILVELDL